MAVAIASKSRLLFRSRCSFSFFILIFTLVFASLTIPAMAADKVVLSVDPSKTGAKIDRNIFGQFAEHLGHGIYEGIWVGPDSHDSEYAGHSQ